MRGPSERAHESVTYALAKAEIDRSIATAKEYPRSFSRFRKQALSLATIDAEVAADCTYAKPQGGTIIRGPSARFAEIIASCWGNLRIGSRTLEVLEFEVVVQGICHDLETNICRTSEVRRSIRTKRGGRYPEHMIVTTTLAASSIAERNAVFRCVPRALWNSILRAAEKVAVGDSKTLSDLRQKQQSWWRRAGVVDERVFAALGVAGLEDIGLDEVVKLKGIDNAIQEGEVTLDEAFPPVAPSTGLPSDDAPERKARPSAKKSAAPRKRSARKEPAPAATPAGPAAKTRPATGSPEEEERRRAQLAALEQSEGRRSTLPPDLDLDAPISDDELPR